MIEKQYFFTDIIMLNKKNFAWAITSVEMTEYHMLLNCVHAHEKLFEQKKICIFGAGIRGTEFAVILNENGYSDILFTDNNQEKWGGVIDRWPIIPVHEILAEHDKYVFLVSPEEGYSIVDQLKKLGLKIDNDFFFFPSVLYDDFIHEFTREYNGQFIAMGDCIFSQVSFHDTCHDSLGLIMKQVFGERNLKVLGMHGMGITGFYHVLRAQVSMGLAPRQLFLMVNFETLTGRQHLLPRSQHAGLFRRMAEIAPDPDGSLHAYAALTAERLNNRQAELFTNTFAQTNLGGNISANSARLFFKVHYMYKLNPDTEHLISLRHLLLFARDHNIHVTPFLPPLNYQLGQELCGEKFEPAYAHNRDIIRRIVEEGGCRLLDISHEFDRELFAEMTTPDETTNYEGRTKVAHLLYEARLS